MKQRRTPHRTVAALLLVAAALPAPAAAQSGGSQPTGNPPPATTPSPVPGQQENAHPAFQGTGMWIWQLPRTYGGSVDRIATKARRHGVRTLFIKSGDGTRRWGQFTRAVVRAFKARGLRVCGWHYVYGRSPVAEASVSAYAKQQGADCFVIDAEAEYEGRYVAADQYIRRLRALVGAAYPLSLTGFPYVDFHPAFPYSVFLAPGRADVNQPQMYWHTIGASVDANFAHTYTWNRIYKRPIFPLGQTYDRAPAREIRRFRQVGRAYGVTGVSWWEWTFTSESSWRALSDPVADLRAYRPSVVHPRLRLRSRGDFVAWAQQHLYAAGQRQVPIDGVFGGSTRAGVIRFQEEGGLIATGVLDDATWAELLKHRPVTVRWRRAGPRQRGVPAAGARSGATVVAPVPRSASLPARRREIPPKR